MINHVSIGVRDLARTKRFYDTALGALGYRCLNEYPGGLGYGREAIAFWVGETPTPVPAATGNGLHLCFDAQARAGVDAFHAAALAAGGRDNGAPGVRADYGDKYYAAFVVDPDGYRLEAVCTQ